jgi:hypothetical protein
MIAKPISIKDAKRKFGGGALESDRTYLGRSAVCHGFVTEDEEIHPDPAAAVSGGRSTHGSEEGPNSKRE